MTAATPPSDRAGRYDRFFALSPDPLCLATPDGLLVDVNPAWERVLGWAPDELIGQDLLGLVHPDDLPATRAEMARIAVRGASPSFENRYRHRDGTWRWLAWSSTPTGEEGLIYAVARDVTQERRARAWAEELQQVSGVGTWELDVDTGRLVLSPEASRIHGLEPHVASTIDPDVIRSLYHPEDAELQDRALARLVSDGVPYDLTLRLRPHPGAATWVRATGRVRLRDDLVVRIYGSLQDVTERQEQQRRLEETNARLERLNVRLERAQELAQLGYWHADLRSGDVDWSEMMFRIFGLDPATDTPSMEAFRAAVSPEDRDLLRDREAEAERTGQLDVVHRIVRPDDTVRTVHALARATVADDGRLLTLTGTLQDVTAVHEAERALLASEQQLARALAATRDGWWEVDLRDGAVRCADRWWELHGYAPAEREPDTELFANAVVEEDLPRVQDRFQEAFGHGEEQLQLRSVALRRDGSTFPVELRVLIEYGPDGGPIRITGTTRDLTEVVRNEQLQEEFLATVSHELRTPLTSIGGALELLRAGRGGPLGDGAEELLAVAGRNTRRLRRLIDDLLDAERLATGRQGIVLRSMRLLPVLERTVEDHLGRPDGGQVAICLEVGPDADVVLPIDPDRVAQVLANYLSNAVRYAPGSSEVRVTVTRSDGYVRVGVLDRGPGVPEGFAERAFTRFSQADPEDARSRGGTGLGLAICREIVERHGGTVGYDSAPGRTEFHFALPIHS